MTTQRENVVISGIGGVFPESNNIDELKELLFNKVNGVTIDSRRWNQNNSSYVSGTGKLKNVDKFDATFFSVHPNLCEVMDAITRIVLERSIEAIIDAGLSPADLHGTNTGVFMGSSISETEMNVWNSSKLASFTMLGQSKTMQANRLSFILNLTGPSFTMDGGWICGSNGLEKAKQMIEEGIIPSAIVGVTNLILRQEVQLQFHGLNKLNKNIHTKSFSSDADGYNRSEACVVLFLQRASEAKRSYGTLINVQSIQFGDQQGHILEHVGNHFKSLLLNSYKEANIDPATVEFIEANGSGIKSEDSMELKIMEEVFCTKQRKIPLKVGSVKSNIGHCEASSLFVSIVKAIIALDSGYIPPNINYTEVNEDIKALKTGKMQVITEKTPFDGDIIGVSSFGIHNAFSHVILKRNPKKKNYLKDIQTANQIPRLVFVSGRNEENVRQSIVKIKSNGNDNEYITLINDVFTRNINAHFYRSFSILPSLDESRMDDIWNVNLKKRPVWYIFSGMGSQWQGMGLHLMNLPIFSDVINKCDSILKPHGIDIENILTSQNPKLFDNILNSFVGIAAIQIGLVEILKALGITPDGILGHSVGELGCAYADGCFTLEETILSAYARGRASVETEFIPGRMAAIGLGYHQINDILPHDIDVACRNSATSCTISGPVECINKFVSELKLKGIFAKAVDSAGIAYHSRYIQSAGPTLLKYLKEVIKKPKLRSSRWISSSLPETEWNTDLAKFSSPEYHTNNLLSCVLFEDTLKHIPSDAITIEIAPHGLLQAIIKGALPDTVTNIPLTKRVYGDSVRFLLAAIGKMYTSGLNPTIQDLYPKITYPVSRETPSIQNLPIWNHDEQWIPIVCKVSFLQSPSAERITSILLNDNIHLIEYRFLGHHIIPFSYVLVNVWKMFIEMNDKTFSRESIQFHNLRFKNNVKIHPIMSTESHLTIQCGSGHFEYLLNDELIFSGEIEFLHNDLFKKSEKSAAILNETFYGCFSKEEIYTFFENSGFDLGENFKNITNFNIYKNNVYGCVKWENDWIYFLDGLLKFPILENVYNCHTEAPVSIRQIIIDPVVFNKHVKRDACINYNTVTKEISCVGIKISNVKTCSIKLNKIKSTINRIEEQAFIHFNHMKCKTINDFIHDSLDIIMETDKFNLNSDIEKLVFYIPYHYDDPIFKECTKIIRQIIEKQQSINSVMLNWENIKNVSKYNEFGRFVTVTNINYLQDTMKALENKKYSYVIVCSQQKMQKFKDWKIITQQKFDDNNCLVLIKKKIAIKKNSVFIKPTNDAYDLSIWTSLQKYNLSKGLIYIISYHEPLEGVSNYINKMLKKYKSEKLRFIFIFDSNAPDFELNKSFYIDQLSIGLIVNIYKNGGWGVYKRIVVQGISDNNLIQFPVLKINSIHRNNKLTIKYLGLNFKDLVVENDTENEYGPLEYSGFIENNNVVMGFTSFEYMSSRINYDPLLVWPVPLSWSLEEAATVSLSYAMSYYVLKVLCSQKIEMFKSDKSILITSALHPIGQAVISISLTEKCTVYAIVDSSHEADQIYNTFPNLSRKNILINTNNRFDIKLKMMTNAKGIDVILNFWSGEAFQAAQRALADHGKFFHFSKSDMKTNKNLGIRQFLRDTSFFVVGSEMLLNEKDENKLIVQQAIMDGLKKGIVKPFRNRVLTPPFSSDKIFKTMRSTKLEKIVLSLNDDFKNSKSMDYGEYGTYTCNPDLVYILVDHKSDWLDLAEWLVDRGAQKLVITVKRCLMSSITCRRFDRLISRNVSIQIESEYHLQKKEESLNWLYRSTSTNRLGSLFIINQYDDKILSNLRYSFEKYEKKIKMASFICISSKGEHICNELKSIGLNSLNISWEGISSKPKSTTKVLRSLDILLQKSNTIGSSSVVCSEKRENITQWYREMNDVITNFFPGSEDELYLLNNKIVKEACFVEVQTRSPRFSQLKSVIPFFVIPGFKPKLTETFCKELLYPAFEARLPENISSIDELSENLVKKLKSISNQGCVSLIGESWGGIVALKIAQILESQGVIVTISLIEGDPEILSGWSKSFLSNDCLVNKLTTLYNSFSREFSKHGFKDINEESQSRNIFSRQKVLDNYSQKALSSIRSKLIALTESKPLSNKLSTKVLIFRYERTTEFSVINLNDYCDNPPVVHVVTNMDYKCMMVDKEVIKAISQNAAYLSPTGVELSLSDKYKNLFYFVQKRIKNNC